MALAAVAVSVDGWATGVLVATGWFVHAGWDWVYHRRNVVVPRGYATFCVVFDVVIGVTALLRLV